MSTAVAVHDGAATAPVESPSTAIATVNRSRPAMLRPIATPGELMEVQNEQRTFIKAALKDGRDFGTFPGVDKASLFKAGAEKVCGGFGVVPRYRIVEQEVDHNREVPWRKVKNLYEWKDGPNGRRIKGDKIGEDVTEGVSLGLYRYVVECELVHLETGRVVGTAIGSCSTLESKYIDRPRDTENTILQMAEKRAFVASTRTTFGLTDEFTQDIEDNPDAFNRGGDADTAGGGTREPQAKCPKCGGRMWDNRPKKAAGEMKPKAPDFKCKDRNCDGLYWTGQWPPKTSTPAEGEQSLPPSSEAPSASTNGEPSGTAKAANGERDPSAATPEQVSRLRELIADDRVNAEVRAKVSKAIEGGIHAQKAATWIDQLETQLFIPATQSPAERGRDADDDIPF